MKMFHVTVMCQAVYNSGIEVPDDYSFEEALSYAREHIKDVPLGSLEWVPDSDVLDEENCGFNDDTSNDAQESKSYVPVTVIRNRECEREQWADTLYLELRPGELVHDSSEAGQLLRSRIQKYLTTTEGWNSNRQSCRDYNWGDFFMDMPLQRFGIVGSEDAYRAGDHANVKLLPCETIRVNQDEMLAPDQVQAILYLYDASGGLLAAPYGVFVNFQSGEITIPPEIETPALESAFSRYTRGEIRIPLGLEPDGSDTVLPIEGMELR